MLFVQRHTGRPGRARAHAWLRETKRKGQQRGRLRLIRDAAVKQVRCWGQVWCGARRRSVTLLVLPGTHAFSKKTTTTTQEAGSKVPFLAPQTAKLASTSCSTCLQDFPESVPGMNSPSCAYCSSWCSQGHHRSEQSGGTSMGRRRFAPIHHTRLPPRQTHLPGQFTTGLLLTKRAICTTCDKVLVSTVP